MVAHNRDWHNPPHVPKPALSASSAELGNPRDLIDESLAVRVGHVAFDGTPHVTLEDIERIAADLLPVAVWRRKGCP